jgi:hypothetical protein
MARAIGQATGKWFGSPATEKGVIGFTAITAAENVVGVTGSAAMMIADTMIAETMIADTMIARDDRRDDR